MPTRVQSRRIDGSIATFTILPDDLFDVATVTGFSRAQTTTVFALGSAVAAGTGFSLGGTGQPRRRHS